MQPKTNRRHKGKNSDEFYDDYEQHDPTLAPDTPTRTPKVQRYMTSTVESRLEQVDEQFSVDQEPNVVVEEKEDL